ncbi:MAG TPA: SCO family protein [Gemmataceae bacterium]|nr:SCO family protein [Gemmataceae bacterium]
MLHVRCAFALLILPLLGCPAGPTRTTGSSPHADVEIPVPEFKLVERSGKTVTRDDLKGKVWVASFVFTRCSGPCPQVTRTMAQLQKELNLSETPDLRLVTFTVDPDKDTPDELRRYAANFRADPDHWLFLTGLPEAELHKLLKDGFKVTAQRSASQKPGDEFDHSSRLVVVDKQGSIRGYYDGIRPATAADAQAEFDENLNRLKSKVAELLKE